MVVLTLFKWDWWRFVVCLKKKKRKKREKKKKKKNKKKKKQKFVAKSVVVYSLNANIGRQKQADLCEF